MASAVGKKSSKDRSGEENAGLRDSIEKFGEEFGDVDQQSERIYRLYQKALGDADPGAAKTLVKEFKKLAKAFDDLSDAAEEITKSLK